MVSTRAAPASRGPDGFRGEGAGGGGISTGSAVAGFFEAGLTAVFARTSATFAVGGVDVGLTGLVASGLGAAGDCISVSEAGGFGCELSARGAFRSSGNNVPETAPAWASAADCGLGLL